MIKNKTKVVATKSTIYRDVDIQTGEVIQEIEQNQIVITRSVSTEEFMQIYLTDLTGLFKLDNKTEIRLMSVIWRECEFNDKNTNIGNRVFILKTIKEKWAKEIGVSLSSINNAISGFVKKGLLITESRSIYIVNPKYFFKGFSKDQPNVMRTILEYNLKPTE